MRVTSERLPAVPLQMPTALLPPTPGPDSEATNAISPPAFISTGCDVDAGLKAGLATGLKRVPKFTPLGRSGSLVSGACHQGRLSQQAGPNRGIVGGRHTRSANESRKRDLTVVADLRPAKCVQDICRIVGIA